MTGIDGMRFRNMVLHSKLISDARNGKKKDLPLGNLLKVNCKTSAKKAKAQSFGRNFRLDGLLKENIWDEGRMPKEEEFEKARVKNLQQMQENSKSGTAATLLISSLGKPDVLLNHGSYLSRKESYVCTQFKLGRFSPFKECTVCQHRNSREHMLSCDDGVVEKLQDLNREVEGGVANRDITPGKLCRCVLLILHKLNPSKKQHLAPIKKLAAILIKARVNTDPDWQEIVAESYADDDDPREALNQQLRKQREDFASNKKKKKKK